MLTRKRLALAAILLVGLSYATIIQSFSWNQTSHYDLIRSLNNDGTTIDAYQENTGDKAFYKGHWYSARAPGLALFALPFYDTLNLVNADSWALKSKAQRGDDEMIYLIGLWANVLPGLLLLLLVWRVAERFEPGYGALTAVALGLGTIVLPLSTLLFSHVFTAFLGFAAFALMLRERDGPPSAMLLGLAGLAMGYAVASEYPLFFVAVVLGLYLLSRRDALTPIDVARRAGAYIAGGVVGIVPLLLYNHYAFRSWTHLAYSNVPRQHKGFFGISLPSLKVLATLLFDSRGLFTLSPVLLMGAIGAVLLYKRSKRAEALTIGGICLCYVGYNSGYYLPFGGGFMGPRFLTTMLPFLAVPLGIAFKRFPAPTIALAAVSITATVIATITHPLTGYETEAVVWVRYLRDGVFQPTLASAFGLGRGWGGIWVFLLAAGAGVVLAVCASPRVRLTTSALGVGVLVLAAWALFAALAPTVLGIDHRGLESIVKAGDHTALSTTRHPSFSSYPLKALAPIAFAAGLLALAAMRLLRNAPKTQGKRPGTATARAAVAASVLGALLCAGAATALAADRGSAAKPPRAIAVAHAGPVSPASSPAAICGRIRAASGPLRLRAGHKRLTMLVTGDSLIYPIDEQLTVGRARGMRVVTDRRDGTGLTTSTVNWDRLSKQQAARVRPDVTVITLGGRDGGIPLQGLAHKLIPCCGTPWLELYADRVRPLIRAYLRGGRGRVYWLLLPAPREALRAPLFEAVNDTLRLLAPEFGASLRLIPNDVVISPGGFQDTITYDGMQIHPRTPDGIHLTHEGACVERSLVIEGLRADGLLSPPRS
jgi:hypothetical protein